MRKLHYHEQKLLKKVDLYQWKSENQNEIAVIKRYQLSNRQDYQK